MSRRASLVVLVVAVLAALVSSILWGPTRRPPRESTTDSVTATRITGSADLADSESKTVEFQPPQSELEGSELVANARPAAPHVATPPIEPALSPPDLHAKAALELLVVDERARPVFDAEVHVLGLRSVNGHGAFIPRRGEEPIARTDRAGRARLDVWEWVDAKGKTKAVDLSVSHSEFAPYRDRTFKLAGGPHTIVLQHGAVVAVRAWHESRDDLIEDVVIDIDRGSWLGREDWTLDEHGAHVSTRVRPGPHSLLVTRPSTDDAHPLLYGRIQEFDAHAGERVELSVELHSAVELAGVLDASVQRPVLDGHVMLGVPYGSLDGDENRLWFWFETDIREDGSFLFRELPAGRGYFFALAHGYVSRLTPAETAFDGQTLTGDPNAPGARELLREVLQHIQAPQRTDIPSPTSPFVLEMEATGAIEITFHDRDGDPIVGVALRAFPYVDWPGMDSLLAPWRDWASITDTAGVARIDNLPVGESMGCSAGDPPLSFVISVQAGRVKQHTIVLAPDYER